MGQKAAVRDLLRDPAWRDEDLGFPLPDSPHACLVSLPNWEAVIGYEESNAGVVGKMRAGYPRFFIHPITRAFLEKLERDHAGEGERVMVYSSLAATERANDFVRRQTGQSGRIETVDDLPLLVVPAEGYQAARDYWRHTGEIVCSRQAEDLLAGVSEGSDHQPEFRAAMAKIMKVDTDDCFLFESGMAAIFTLFRIVTEREPGKKTLQLSFPYVDALKVQQLFGSGADFVSDAQGEQLQASLAAIRSGEYAAVFCEVPSNPLLNTVDLHAVSEACRAVGTPLLVDDTVCSHLNIDALPLADAVSTSLTKWVSGIGDVMAGSVKLNRNSSFSSELRGALLAQTPGGSRLYQRDAEVLARNAQGLSRRVADSNLGGEFVAEFLEAHPAVDRVYFPKLVDRENYDALRTADGSYGGLLSFTLKTPERAPAVYRAMRFSKGPSLGTEYSLLCPYTLLAHYPELEWAQECGVPTELLRLSVGREPVDELQARLGEALKLA